MARVREEERLPLGLWCREDSRQAGWRPRRSYSRPKRGGVLGRRYSGNWRWLGGLAGSALGGFAVVGAGFMGGLGVAGGGDVAAVGPG